MKLKDLSIADLKALLDYLREAENECVSKTFDIVKIMIELELRYNKIDEFN